MIVNEFIFIVNNSNLNLMNSDLVKRYQKIVPSSIIHISQPVRKSNDSRRLLGGVESDRVLKENKNMSYLSNMKNIDKQNI